MKKQLASRIRLIKRHRSYNSRELAALLGVHRRTIQEWVKDGLKPIDHESGRFLFKGETVKAFLNIRRKQRKCPLRQDEFYCPRCRGPRVSLLEMLGYEPNWRETSAGKILVTRMGQCSVCSCPLRRFTVVERDLLTANGSMQKARETGLESSVYTLSECAR